MVLSIVTFIKSYDLSFISIFPLVKYAVVLHHAVKLFEINWYYY